jgi:peptidoglycan/xylan/chitin deacetylase (PgdA/CDA1 family)
MIAPKLLVKRTIKSVAALALGFRAASQNTVTIMGYHRVVADLAQAETDSIYGLVVSAGTFREHCRIMKENFDVVSLEDASDFLERGERSVLPKAVITFDDGYLDNYEQAFPILREFGLPATIFLPTTMIGGDEPLAHDKAFWLAKIALERGIDVARYFESAGLKFAAGDSRDLLEITDCIVYVPATQRDFIINCLETDLAIDSYPRGYKLLNWDQVREMERGGINFGNHTATHPVLPLEDASAFVEEVFESKAILDARLEKPSVSFAYPNGRYNAEVREQIVKAGFHHAVTTEKHVNKFGQDLFALGRTCLCEESTRGVRGTYSPRVAKFRFGVGAAAAS